MKELTLTFTTDEVNLILQSLGQQPFMQVHELIIKIQTQAAPQVQEGTKGKGD